MRSDRTSDDATARAVEAVWRIESAKLIAVLARMVGDVGVAEELAQDALVAALEQWPASGIPRNPAAWLTSVAKRRAIDGWRRQERLGDKYAQLARDLETEGGADDPAQLAEEVIEDDLLRLVFITCHPVLTKPSRVALTLKLLGRPLDGRDRARVPGTEFDDRPAHRAGETHPDRLRGCRSRCPT